MKPSTLRMTKSLNSSRITKKLLERLNKPIPYSEKKTKQEIINSGQVP